MNWPHPRPGMVIRYSYLWLSEHQQGREEARKDRPAAVILVIDDHPQHPLVTVLPITHTPPVEPTAAMEIPHATRRRLKLGDDPSWVVLTEANDFRWPGPDLRPVPQEGGSIAYGMLPPRLFQGIRERLLGRVRGGEHFLRVRRTE